MGSIPIARSINTEIRAKCLEARGFLIDNGLSNDLPGYRLRYAKHAKAIAFGQTKRGLCPFLVPKDLRALVGSRFLVRPLHAPFGDVARLVAARCMGMALSQAFQALRQGQAVDTTVTGCGGGVQQLIFERDHVPNGARD